MKHVFAFTLLMMFSFAGISQDIPVYTTFEKFEKEVLTIESEKVYVVNFWATWCGPCVKELPYFEDLKEEYNGKEVETILVSIDWETNLTRKLIPFLQKNEIKKKVILFDDPKANDWIDKVDPSWSGAIPITLVMSKDGKHFYEKEYHSTSEIEDDIIKFINK